jgi:predicted alpha/beta hydrolase family esterase
MTRHLLVPGRGRPKPQHWQQQWSAKPGHRWAPEPPGPPFVLEERVAALHEIISENDEPAILIAHSAGCRTTVSWAARHTGPVHAALLVAAPHFPDAPRTRLPFTSILVASRTDPYCTFEDAQAYARDWGAELVDAGDAGHIDTSAGYGPWPDGERLVQRLA